jgi:hypothetical protein
MLKISLLAAAAKLITSPISFFAAALGRSESAQWN